VPRERPDVVEPPPDWDPTTVTEATTGVIAADEHSAILAVSRPAAELLGYDAAELVGERLVRIVPERYQQAHLAGFTMYLLVGRRPMLGVPVHVPALRRDGTEVGVELVIHDLTLGGGRSVLLADIRPHG
jgi:PAS domain S-box-containing protein